MSHLYQRLKWVSIVVVLGIAIFLRLWTISIYPPGFHYDEAVNLILARQIAYDGARPFPVYAAFNGREVLYHYLGALGVLGLGNHIFTMRLVSAFSNILTVALTIGIGQAMFGKRRGVVLGVFAAGFMAVSFPQIYIARQSFRAVTLPLMQALSLWLLVRGLRQPKHTLWLPLAGMAGGAALYTYMASRLWPVWMAIFVLAYIISQRDKWQFRLQQGVIVGGFLLLAAGPILNYYAQNPDVFNDRLSQLGGDAEAPTYLESVWLHAKMFFVEGDPYIRYNAAPAPYFDPLSGLLFLIGLATCGLWLLKERCPLNRASYLLILCAPLMLFPSVLAVGGLPPSHMRSIGMIPLIFFLPALGMEQVALWLDRIRKPYWQTSRFIVVGLIFIVMGISVGVRYQRWASNDELFYLTDGDMVAAGAWLEDHITQDTLIYITSLHYDHPSLQIYDIPGDNITYLLGDRFYFPPMGRKAYFVDIPNAPLSPIFAEYAAYFGEGVQHYNADGRLAFTVFEYGGNPPLVPPTSERSSENIGGWLRLRGAVQETAMSGEQVTLLTQWDILGAPPYPDFTPLFQLETPEGDVLDRIEPYSARTNFWHAGATMIQSVTFTIPPATPPDAYRVRVAWVGRSADQYAGRIDEQGRFAGIWNDVGTLTVMRPTDFDSDPFLAIPVPRQTHFGAVQLLGHSVLPDNLRPGEPIGLDLYWQASTTPTTPTLQLVASDEDEAEYIWWEGAPVMNRYPFTAWQAGEWILDRHRWRLPTDVVGGRYRLWLKVGDQRVELGTVQVTNLNRTFEPPTPLVEQLVSFNALVQLVGYDLSATTLQRGDTLHLTLYWQSLAITDLPLTVFVHLTDFEGVNQAQSDMQPRQNSYPIALWAVGEYVDDSYTLTLPETAPSGPYTLRVGLYLQANGQRLQISDHDNDFWTIATIMVE